MREYAKIINTNDAYFINEMELYDIIDEMLRENGYEGQFMCLTKIVTTNINYDMYIRLKAWDYDMTINDLLLIDPHGYKKDIPLNCLTWNEINYLCHKYIK